MARCYLCCECDALFAVHDGDAMRGAPVCPVCLSPHPRRPRTGQARSRTIAYIGTGRGVVRDFAAHAK